MNFNEQHILLHYRFKNSRKLCKYCLFSAFKQLDDAKGNVKCAQQLLQVRRSDVVTETEMCMFQAAAQCTLLNVVMRCFIHFRARFSSGESRDAGTAALERLETPRGQQQSERVLLAPHQGGTKQDRRCSHSIRFLDDIWATSRGCIQQESPRQFFVGHSGYMAEPKQLGSIDWEEKWLEIQGFANFTAEHFVAKCHTVNFSQNRVSAACHLG